MPAGTNWGAKWEYGWFIGLLKLDERARNHRIVLILDPVQRVLSMLMV